jgi:glycosyltransferase involved in cell wall biosynthesis
MKEVLIITFVDFWLEGAGHRTRISSLIDYLRDKMNVTVFYLGTVEKSDVNLIQNRFPGISMASSGFGPESPIEDFAASFNAFIGRRTFDKALIEYIEASFVLEYISPQVITFLDTHDILHEKINSFEQSGLTYSGIKLTREQEFEIYCCYDYVLCIQQAEYNTVVSALGGEKILLVPHAVSTVNTGLRSEVRAIGFIGSEFLPNCHGLEWFLDEIWPSIYAKYGIGFLIFGNVSSKIKGDLKNQPGVSCRGFVEDIQLAYQELDIIVNPVRAGAGLKIKNIEGMGYGKPIVTTLHGAAGLGEAGCIAYLVANTGEEFKRHLESLIDNREWRKAVSDNALDFVKRHFAPENCYHSLVQKLLE